MTQNEAERIIVGRISGVYGVKGWVKVYSYTSPRDNIRQYSPWLLHVGNEWLSVKVDASRMQGKGVVAHLEGCDDRDEARKFIDAEIAVLRSQLAPTQAGEYYWRDLIGLQVVNIRGEVLGTVDHLMETGANDVLAVKPLNGEAGTEMLLIPYVVDDVIKHVDLENGTCEVDWETDY